jgi:hypothetical protein
MAEFVQQFRHGAGTAEPMALFDLDRQNGTPAPQRHPRAVQHLEFSAFGIDLRGGDVREVQFTAYLDDLNRQRVAHQGGGVIGVVPWKRCTRACHQLSHTTLVTSQEVPRGLLVAGGDGTKLLDPGEEVLDQMACGIKLSVIAARRGPVGSRRDGCNRFRTFRRIYALALLSRQELQPATVGIYSFVGAEYADWNRVMAFSSVFVVPILVLQRRIVVGLTAGALK